MDSVTSSSTARFRFRDHNQEMADDFDSSEGHTSGDSSSISSNENEEAELQSMTAKGVQHLCSELVELKQESDEDFQKNIFSNYSAFLLILKEIEGLQTELLGLTSQASSQQILIKDFSDKISLTALSEETIESMFEETLLILPPSSSPSTLETHVENVSEILDALLSEHRLDDALAILEMEGEFVQDLQSGENFSSDLLMYYNSTISEKRAMLADQFILIAKHPRVSAAELQKALVGLSQLGHTHPATQLMLQYYNSRINNFRSSKEFSAMLYIQELAKFVCSMISQAVKSFVALNGKKCPYSSELTQWASEEVKDFAVCLIKCMESISEISARLSRAIDAMHIAMSYCSLLETQRIFLLPSLMEHVRPYMEEVLQVHVDHLSKVVSIFTLNDTWVLGRYYVSGILTGRSCGIIDQQPEYYFLTNSGRKFLTLFQSVVEDILPLIALQMEGSVLKGMMDLLTAYIVILESALTGDTDVIEKEGFRVNLPESTHQGVFILANLSTLIQFSSTIIRNIFDGIHQFKIDNYIMYIQDIYNRLKACFLGQFISNIFSPNGNHESGPEISISCHGGDSRIHDLIPSVPYLELYLELKKLQKLVDGDCIDMNWLLDLLREVMDVAFEWISTKSEIWTISEEDLADHRTEFMQFILDAQFLVEIARSGGHLSDNVKHVSTDIISRLEASFVPAGLNPLRDSNDHNWPANAAIQALLKLQELHAKESLEGENATTAGEESLPYLPQTGSDIPFEDDDRAKSEDNPVTVDSTEFAIDTNTEASKTEDTIIREVDLEKQKTLHNRDLYGEVETKESRSRIRNIKLPKTSSDTNDLQTGQEPSACMYMTIQSDV